MIKKTVLCIIVGLLTSGAQASFNQLLDEFLQSNTDIKSSQEDFKITQLKYESTMLSKGLQLSLSSLYDDNKLDTSSAINFSSSKSMLYSLGLSKSFFSGTTVTLNNNLTNTDRTMVNSAFLGSSPAVINEFNQEVTITQSLGKNFAGQIERNLRDQAKKSVSIQDIATKEYADGKVTEFYSAYLQAVLALENMHLQERAYQRAIARTKLVRKKWRDGLVEKVEVLQAHNTQMSQKETLQTYKVNLSSALKKLGSLIHRTITSKEIVVPELDELKISSYPTGEITKSYGHQRLKKSLELEKMKLIQGEDNTLPTIELSAGYKTNNFDEKRSEALKNGYLGQGDNEIKVGVTLTTQWGSKSEKNALEQQRAALRKSKYTLSKYEVDFSLEKKALTAELELLGKNMALALERVNIANQVLREYTRLYRVGKTDLDQLIRSEESLIGTEVSLISYYISYEQKAITLAKLYGNVERYLRSRTFSKGVTIEKHH